MRMVLAPFSDLLAEKRMCTSPLLSPMRIWLIFGCQVMLVSAAPGLIACVSSLRSVAAERMWRFPASSPVRMLLEEGEKMRLLSGWIGVGKSVRVVTGVLSFLVSHTAQKRQPSYHSERDPREKMNTYV